MQSINASFAHIKEAIVAELRSDSEMLEDHVVLLERVLGFVTKALHETHTALAKIKR